MGMAEIIQSPLHIRVHMGPAFVSLVACCNVKKLTNYWAFTFRSSLSNWAFGALMEVIFHQGTESTFAFQDYVPCFYH